METTLVANGLIRIDVPNSMGQTHEMLDVFHGNNEAIHRTTYRPMEFHLSFWKSKRTEERSTGL